MSENFNDSNVAQTADGSFVMHGAAMFALQELVPADSTVESTVVVTAEDGDWHLGMRAAKSRFDGRLGSLLFRLGVLGAQSRQSFVIAAQAPRLAEDGQLQPASTYSLCNGKFDSRAMTMRSAIGFRDFYVRSQFGAVFRTHDFDEILAVVRSEFTGDRAFPEG